MRVNPRIKAGIAAMKQGGFSSSDDYSKSRTTLYPGKIADGAIVPAKIASGAATSASASVSTATSASMAPSHKTTYKAFNEEYNILVDELTEDDKKAIRKTMDSSRSSSVSEKREEWGSW